MKTLKLFLVLGAFTLSSVAFANTAPKFKNLKAISAQVENLLHGTDHAIEKGTTVTIFFSVTEDRKIQFMSVVSNDEAATKLVQKELQKLELEGDSWKDGKIYELSVGYTDLE